MSVAKVSRLSFLMILGTVVSFDVGDDLLQDVSKVCSQFCVVQPQNECAKKPLLQPDIYAPMDRIDGLKTAATGVDITLRGSPKPSIQPGKYGGSIFLANTGTLDDKFLDLGYLRGRCVDNLDKCTNGLTVSFWFWLDNRNHDWPVLISASQWQVHTHSMPGRNNEPYMTFFKNRNKRYYLGGHSDTSLSNEQWHHVAFVFRSYDDFKLYVDGALNAQVSRFDQTMALTDKHIQVGCHMGGNCARAKFDELKIWEQSLTSDDINDIYNQKTTVQP